MDKSTAECNAINTANREAIDAGLIEEVAPTDYVLEQEKRAARAAAIKAAGPFVADCYICGGCPNGTVPAKVVRTTKTTTVAVTEGGLEYTFAGTRDGGRYGQRDTLYERGEASRFGKWLDFDVEKCAKMLAEEAANKARQQRTAAAN